MKMPLFGPADSAWHHLMPTLYPSFLKILLRLVSTSALKCSFILFLKLNFLLLCKLLSPGSGWPLRVLFLLASCNTYFKMRKSKKSQLTKTLCVEGMTQNRAGNPWLSALCKLPKISLFIYRAFSAGSC